MADKSKLNLFESLTKKRELNNEEIIQIRLFRDYLQRSMFNTSLYSGIDKIVRNIEADELIEINKKNYEYKQKQEEEKQEEINRALIYI